MGQSLSSETVVIRGVARDLNAWPVVIAGVDSTGKPVALTLGSDGGIVQGTPTGTYVTVHVANSASLSGGIPVTAKRWAVNFIGTGTANTFGANTAVTGGQGFSDNATPSAPIAIACDGSTVADVIYSTT